MSNAAYHARTLLDAKVVELSSMQPMKGSLAHYYSLTKGNGAAAVRAIYALDGKAVSESQWEGRDRTAFLRTTFVPRRCVRVVEFSRNR